MIVYSVGQIVYHVEQTWYNEGQTLLIVVHSVYNVGKIVYSEVQTEHKEGQNVYHMG